MFTKDKRSSIEKMLDKELYTVPRTNTKISYADAMTGHLITGTTGSGKTSGPAHHIAQAMLKAGFGFCVFCIKKGERQMWEQWAEEAGRSSDLVIFNKASGKSFNFLEYQMQRAGDGSGEINNVINTLMNLHEQSRVHNPTGGGKENRFWDNSMRQLMNMNIALLSLAGEEISIKNMRKVTASCFKGKETRIFEAIQNKIKNGTSTGNDKEEAIADLHKWADANYFVSLLTKIDKRNFSSEQDLEDAKDVVNYWLNEFPNMGKRTGGIILTSFHGIVDHFVGKGILRDHFSHGLSPELQPEHIIKNKKILIVDFPVKEFMLSGIFGQTIVKMMFQEALERREIEKEVEPRPFATWIDEYQSLCSPLSDTLFQLSARSVMAATVYITQNILNLQFMMGDNMPRERAKSLISNLNIKYWCANDCQDTNEYASATIGDHLSDTDNVSIDEAGKVSRTKNQSMQRKVTPDFFTTLKTGRKENDFKVEAVVFKVGNTWGKDKENYALTTFKQV